MASPKASPAPLETREKITVTKGDYSLTFSATPVGGTAATHSIVFPHDGVPLFLDGAVVNPDCQLDPKRIKALPDILPIVSMPLVSKINYTPTDDENSPVLYWCRWYAEEHVSKTSALSEA